jgi:hypothetical protein
LADGTQACVSIAHIDGLVLARSSFHHSMNYRSVVIYGQFERTPEEHKAGALERFMQRVGAGREHEARPPDPTELAATTILYISTTEAAAKIRVGGPRDDEADLTRPVWSGVLPMRTQQCDPRGRFDHRGASLRAILAPSLSRSLPTLTRLLPTRRNPSRPQGACGCDVILTVASPALPANVVRRRCRCARCRTAAGDVRISSGLKNHANTRLLKL